MSANSAPERLSRNKTHDVISNIIMVVGASIENIDTELLDAMIPNKTNKNVGIRSKPDQDINA